MDRELVKKIFRLSEDEVKSVEKSVELDSIHVYRVSNPFEDEDASLMRYGVVINDNNRPEFSLHTVCILKNKTSGRWCRGITVKNPKDNHNKFFSRRKAFGRALGAALCPIIGLDHDESIIHDFSKFGVYNVKLTKKEEHIVNREKEKTKEKEEDAVY